LAFFAVDLRPPAPGAIATTGEHGTWGVSDDEFQAEVEEDPLEEDENPWKNPAWKFYSPKIARASRH
jgi:hypothetical protein